jgi:hypothetical protein
MTVTATYTPDQYTGTGANTALATTFVFNDSSEVVVTSRVTATGVETVLTETTHYTVTGGSYATGTVTPVDGATDFPSTVTWTLSRTTPLTQSTDWVENDDFPAESHEAAADKLTLIAQERDWNAQRSLKYPGTDGTSLSAELPSSVDRASKSLGFDAAGEPVALAGTVSGDVTVTGYMETVLDDGSAAVARATLEAQEDVISARGSLVRGDSAGAAEELTVGNNGTVVLSDGTDVSFGTLESMLTFIPFSRGHIKGLTATRASATNISIAEGQCRAGSSANQNLINGVNAQAFTKDFDNGGWVAGTGNGGVPTAAGFAAAADDWHYFMLVGTDGTKDFGYDTSPTAANLIADAAVQAALTATVYYRRLFSFRSSATPDIPDFTQDGDNFRLATSTQDISTTNPGTNEVAHALPSVPGNINVGAIVSLIWNYDGNAYYIYGGGDEDLSARTPGVGDMDAMTVGGGTARVATVHATIRTDTSRQIKTHQDASAAGCAFYVQTHGWVDRRGQDD